MLVPDPAGNTESQIKIDKSASVAKSLFLGNIIEENLFPFPQVEPEEEETLKMVLESVDRFLEGYREEFFEYDASGEQPPEYREKLKELGLFGLVIPESHEGMGFSSKSYARVLQQTSRYDGSTSLTIGAHSSIGMRGLLLFGSDEQKERYLARLSTGELVAAFCLTEAGSGSDAASIKTHAEKQSDGTWLLNGEKIWITNGPFADFFTVFARTDTENGKLSAFLVERGFEGVKTGPKEDKMGIRASGTCTVFFENVKVPAENLLGEEGKGFKIAMGILNSGRSGLGGGCVGGMKEAIRLASQYAVQRKQFGRSIADFQLMKQKIAQMTVDCYAAESLVHMVAHYSDVGCEDFSVEAAVSKVFGTESLWKIANEALQISGGNGFMREYPYERMVRDSRINMIFEGTNEILRLFIALNGLKGAGEYLKEIGKTGTNFFNDPIKGFGILSGYAAKRFTQLTSLGRDRIAFIPKPLEEEGRILEQYTVQLGRVSEATLRRYRKDIIGSQYVTARLADTVMDLFTSLCVLSRTSSLIAHQGEEKSQQAITASKLFVQRAKRRMNQNLRRVDINEDDLVTGLADYIFSEGDFPWDVIS